MKLTFVLAALAAVAASSSAQSVSISGAQTMQQPTTAMDVRIASRSVLDQATALLNKNTVSSDNNVFIARSNVIFQQNDRIAMRGHVMEALKTGVENHMTAAVINANMLRAIAAPMNDAVLMTKASAIIASAGESPSALVQRITDFVDAVGMREMEFEQSIQSQTPRGVIVLVGTKDLLRQPTAVINKNIAASDNQISVVGSNVAPQQNDQVAMAGGAMVADVVAPAASINVGRVSTTQSEKAEPEYRVAIVYPKDQEADGAMEHKEQWGYWGSGWGQGWRYPLGYWNTFGRGFYGGGCGLGFARGPFYYC